ncbi:hypothetical protein HS088_TW01G00524 [Tripterygium wilfordii]|uniref:Uncharacterized protein n=1 Tax=Tripterygium wilfordii TaxID=458696 RepID=A0A7J7E235_TRIWF|nr:hypothetical protein HS088_TW01G00524 [Tripterygium wilfordii]
MNKLSPTKHAQAISSIDWLATWLEAAATDPPDLQENQLSILIDASEDLNQQRAQLKRSLQFKLATNDDYNDVQLINQNEDVNKQMITHAVDKLMKDTILLHVKVIPATYGEHNKKFYFPQLKTLYERGYQNYLNLQQMMEKYSNTAVADQVLQIQDTLHKNEDLDQIKSNVEHMDWCRLQLRTLNFDMIRHLKYNMDNYAEDDSAIGETNAATPENITPTNRNGKVFIPYIEDVNNIAMAVDYIAAKLETMTQGLNPEIRIAENEQHLLSNNQQHKTTRESDLQNELHNEKHMIPDTEYAAQTTKK